MRFHAERDPVGGRGYRTARRTSHRTAEGLAALLDGLARQLDDVRIPEPA